MIKAEFSASLLQSSVSHDPSEIICAASYWYTLISLLNLKLGDRKCCRWRQTLETWRKNWMNNEDSEENLETLQEYIDWCFDVIVMKKNQNACSPAKSETPSSKRSRPADSPETTSPTGKSFTDILDSIDKRLSSFDARLSLVEILHREFKSLRESLEFSQQQVETLAAENASLRDSVKSLTENMTHLSEENKRDCHRSPGP